MVGVYIYHHLSHLPRFSRVQQDHVCVAKESKKGGHIKILVGIVQSSILK
jgi:hypothetical protein